MAEIRPFKGWRYAPEYDIHTLTSPLFDVVSEKQRAVLYENPLNSIHLSVPKSSFSETAQLLEQWKKQRILVQDPLPGIYVYYQYFQLPNDPKPYCRKGFIANIRIHDWHEKIILRHENTLPHSVNDRKELLECTLLQSSPTHGLIHDSDQKIEKILDRAIENPIYETEDYQGVRDVFAVIHDFVTIRSIMKLMQEKKVILADGHHRYSGSLAWKNECKSKNVKDTGEEPYHFHMMYITPATEDSIRILPTHRIIQNLPSVNTKILLEKAAEYFHIKEIENVFDLEEMMAGKKDVFGWIIEERAFKLRLKEEIAPVTWNFPKEILELELTKLHFYLLDQVLGLEGKHQRTDEHIVYERHFAACWKKVTSKEADMAFITNPVTINDVFSVCESGYTMPPKSTYFYPKAICGFIFGSLKEDECTSTIDFRL